MTMEIKIVNADNSRVLEIREQEFDVMSNVPQTARESRFHLGPGETRSVWIHAAKTVLITEDPNATMLRPVTPQPPPSQGEER